MKKENKEKELSATSKPKLPKGALAPAWGGYEATASQALASTSRTSSRISAVSPSRKDELCNIRQGVMPFECSEGDISVREAIILCQKAYFNVSAFRTTIDIMTEFSNSCLRFDGGTRDSKEFFQAWYEKINGCNLGDQFFREWYRSGNVFLYRLNYNFSDSEIKKLKTVKRKESILANKELPIRYVFLNPADIKARGASSFLNVKYYKLLNNYERDRLKDPKTEEERRMLNSLDPEARKSIKSGGQASVELKQENLITLFAKKMDYESLAVPMYYPVLFDINLKLEFKKVEAAIAKTIDYVILLVTLGAKPDDGGTDPEILKAMQGLFLQESVGRVLVADYTTKADFVIPDLNKILGSEKYKVVNRDIAQGLMNIFFDDDQKFANSMVKIKVFLERLSEARRVYLEQFLIPEMEKVAEQMNFRELPSPRFEEINLQDDVQLQRLYTRLAEIGFLTPEEVFEINETGIFPTATKSEESQKNFKKLRDEGLYDPVIGGGAQESGRPIGDKAPQTTKKPGVQKDVKDKGTNVDTTKTKATYSVKAISNTSAKLAELTDIVQDEYKAHFGIKRMSKNKKESAFEFVKLIACNEEHDKWADKKVVKDYLTGSKVLEVSVLDEIKDISEEHSLDDFSASILYHSRRIGD